MRPTILFLALLLVPVEAIFAQIVRIRVQYGTSVSLAEFDGDTITHSSIELSVVRRRSSAPVTEIDFDRTRVRVENGSPYIEFFCKAGTRCWSDGPGYDSYIDHNVGCPSVQECQAFLDLLRVAVDTRYSPSRRPPAPSPPAPPESVIDGSKIPSRIDFPGPSKTAPAPTQITVRIARSETGFVNVRVKPSTSSAIVGKVKPGETYAVSEVSAGWYRLTVKEGWVAGRYVTVEGKR